MDAMDEDKEPTIVSIVIGSLYVIGIGINVYLVADQLSNGALSRSVSLHTQRMIGKLKASTKRQQEYERAKGQVVWEAINIVENHD